MNGQAVYISILIDSLRKKIDVLKELLRLTEEQADILSAQSFDMDAFDAKMDLKQVQLDQMKELDDGFESLYQKVRQELAGHTQAYRQEVMELQNYIRVITDLGVQIEAKERRNKDAFSRCVKGQRQTIREFNVNNKTANMYSKHMANQHMSWQSYFLDQKK